MEKIKFIGLVALLALVAVPSACIVQGTGAAIVYLNKPSVTSDWEKITSSGTLNENYAYQDGNIVYKGHYGYYVVLGKNKFGNFVAIKIPDTQGTGAMQLSPFYVLGEELKWLSERGAITGLNDDDYAKIVSASSFSASYATYLNGTWASVYTNCDPDGVCYKCGAPSTGAGQMPSLQVLDIPATEQAPSGQEPSAGAGVSSAPAGTGAEEQAAEGGLEKLGVAQYLPYLAAFVLAAGIGALALYQLAFRQQVLQQFDPVTQMALSNETRLEIMQELEGAERIPTDLSTKIGKSKATIVEHLEKLIEAGLVERIETPGKKFVYYRLTGKGRTALLRRAA